VGEGVKHTRSTSKVGAGGTHHGLRMGDYGIEIIQWCLDRDGIMHGAQMRTP
jgi:hypothetical protein